MRQDLYAVTALVLSTLPVVIAGCVGSSAPARLYVLTPGPEAAVVPSGAGPACSLALGVGPVRLPGLLDRPQIVTRRGADEITQAEFDRWAEPLAESVPRVLAENLAALQKTDRVAIFPWNPAGSVQYQLVVDVMRFDGAVGGDVVLDARWRILATDGKELAVHRSVLTQPTGRSGYQAVVTAMSRSLMALSREIAATLETLPCAVGGRPEEALPSPGTDRGAGRGSDLVRGESKGGRPEGQPEPEAYHRGPL